MKSGTALYVIRSYKFPIAPANIINKGYFLILLFLIIIKKIIKTIVAINKLNKLYKLSWLNDNNPNAIPSFQTKLIFRYLDWYNCDE